MDPGDEKNYYRLLVRSLQFGGIYVNDLFSSTDILFEDKNISVSHNGWPVFFSNVFDDTICDGASYEFTVEIRQRQSSDEDVVPYVVIELQQISEAFYKYLKAIEIFNCSASDIYAEPVRIPSNVEGGIGIVGSLTGNRHILYF